MDVPLRVFCLGCRPIIVQTLAKLCKPVDSWVLGPTHLCSGSEAVEWVGTARLDLGSGGSGGGLLLWGRALRFTQTTTQGTLLKADPNSLGDGAWWWGQVCRELPRGLAAPGAPLTGAG